MADRSEGRRAVFIWSSGLQVGCVTSTTGVIGGTQGGFRCGRLRIHVSEPALALSVTPERGA